MEWEEMTSKGSVLGAGKMPRVLGRSLGSSAKTCKKPPSSGDSGGRPHRQSCLLPFGVPIHPHTKSWGGMPLLPAS